MAFVKAERKRAKARVAIIGPSGSGKSMGALLLAKGLGGKIAGIDTENGSLSLYSHITDFDVQELVAPYTPERYIELIHEAESAGYDTIIIDSLTHEWQGVGGLLEAHEAIMQGQRVKNAYTAWAAVTPRHQALIDAMLQSSCNIIATIRSKTEYAQSEENGKKSINKVGMAPQQRDGMDYEFTLMFDVNVNHVAAASKDRTSLFDGRYEKLGEAHGRELREWLNSGKEAQSLPADPPKQKTSPEPTDTSSTQAAADPLANPAQCRHMHIVGSNKGLSKEGFVEWLSASYEVGSTKEIKQTQIAELCGAIEALTEAEIKEFNDLGAAKKADAKSK